MKFLRTHLVWLLYFAFAPLLFAQPVVTLVSPTNQSHFGKAIGMELNILLDASVINPGPGTTYVDFFDNLTLIGSPSSQRGWAMTWSNVSFGSHTLIARLGETSFSNPVNVFVDQMGLAFVNETSIWNYLDGGADPGPAWFATDFDASPWASGLPQFGFGESDERTIVNFLNPTNGGGSIFPTYYFRHAFTVTNAAAISNLVVRLLRDDGAVVYLNGQELFRDNMPDGTISNTTYAVTGAAPENEFVDHWVNPASLVEGTNCLAAEVHNQGAHSEDISFDLRLIADLPTAPPRMKAQRNGTSVILSWPKLYLGYRLQATEQLGVGSWETVTNVFTGTAEFGSTNGLTSPAKFYRLTL